MYYKNKIIIVLILGFMFTIGCLFPIIADNSLNKQILVDKIDTTDNNILTAGITTILYDVDIKNNIDISDNDINIVTTTPKYKIGYATTTVNIRLEPSTDAEILSTYNTNDKIKYIEKDIDGIIWGMVEYQEDLGYVRGDYISDEKVDIVEQISTYNGEKLTKSKGVVYGPSGKETYYNLPMNGVIRLMKDLGYDYEYWVREDGCKMYGDYIMLAANTNIYPKGTIIETSLGNGCVCDHCERAEYDPVFDLAVDWK